MKTFWLDRNEDISGVSGTGKIAEGVEFTDGGSVVLRWCAGGPSSISVWASLEDMISVHGHGGATVIRWE